ncbi:MAG: ribosome hibernation-promoting factor, HPF/YfiA family [Candidatus Methylomirabilia bacterium]
MQVPIAITGRHIDISEPIRDLLTERLGHACKLLEKISSAHVTISVEKNRHIVEITVHSHGSTLQAKEETHDMYASIDQAVDKIETQAKRLKEKIKDRKHVADAGEVAAVEDEVAPLRSQVFVAETFAPKPLSVNEAVESLQSSPGLFLVFHNAKNGLVNVLYKRGDGNFGLVQPPA